MNQDCRVVKEWKGKTRALRLSETVRWTVHLEGLRFQGQLLVR